MGKDILVQINFFGPVITNLADEDIPKLINGELKPVAEIYKILLESFFEFPLSALSVPIIKRYMEVTTKEIHSSIVPSTEQLHVKLLRPLSSAKRNYCLGDYLATIAVSGMIAEMLTGLIWVMHGDSKEKINGKRFDDLSHAKRINLLLSEKIIPKLLYDDFDFIKKIRNKYLHSWKADFSNEKKDAMASVKKAFKLYKKVVQVSQKGGKVAINPLLLKLFP